jgi:hypothetical protein
MIRYIDLTVLKLDQRLVSFLINIPFISISKKEITEFLESFKTTKIKNKYMKIN